MKYSFTEDDIDDMSEEDFEQAITGLIDKGLIEVVEKDGVKSYRATTLLESLEDHFDSDPKARN